MTATLRLFKYNILMYQNLKIKKKDILGRQRKRWERKLKKEQANLCTYEKLYRILPDLGACHYYNHHISANRTESSQTDPCQAHPVLLPDKKIITMKLHSGS